MQNTSPINIPKAYRVHCTTLHLYTQQRICILHLYNIIGSARVIMGISPNGNNLGDLLTKKRITRNSKMRFYNTLPIISTIIFDPKYGYKNSCKLVMQRKIHLSFSNSPLPLPWLEECAPPFSYALSEGNLSKLVRNSTIILTETTQISFW